MKTIKVFIASSDELRNERLEFSDLVLQLNDLFEKRDLQIKLVKWEHLDSSMGKEHKQTEYNQRLKECEICLTLYWTKFGDYTTEELETAYSELKEGRNPRKLYVFFKDAEEITPELKQFKDSFATAYGHFYCRFENVDTMRLHFLLQLEAYHNNTSDKLLAVKNQRVTVEGEPIVNLNNVPFAAMNKEFIRLRDTLEKLSKSIERSRKRLAKDPTDDDTQDELDEQLTERNKLQQELDQHQEFLFDLARKTSLLSTQRISNRSSEAIRLFNLGDAAGANAILNTEDLTRDKEQCFKNLDEHSKLIAQDIEQIELIYKDFKLKTDTALTDENYTIDERIAQVDNAYTQAIECAKELTYQFNNKEEYADIIFNYAWFSDKYANYEKAKELYLENITLEKELHGEQSSQLATSYNNLGGAYYKQGERDQALEYFFKSVKIKETEPNKKHTDIATIYNNIGLVYYEKEENAKALEYHLKSLSINKEMLAEEHPSIANNYNNLGLVYLYKKEYSKALEYHTKALNINIKMLGEEHPSIADNYNNLGLVYDEQKNYTKSLEYHFKALNISRITLGEQHPNTADSYGNIGKAYDNLGNYAYALENYLKAFDILKKRFGLEHSYTQNTALYIRNIYYKLGNECYESKLYSDALPLYLKALEIEESVLGENNIDTANTYYKLGETYFMLNDRSNAYIYFKRSRDIHEMLLGEHTDVAQTYSTVGYLTTDIAEELACHLTALEIREKLLGADNIDTAQSNFDVSSVYIDMGEHDNALKHLHKALDARVKSLGENSNEVALTTNNIGYLYNETGKYEKALEFHKRSLKSRLSIYSDDSIDTANSYHHIGKTYYKLGEYVQALEWLNKAYPIRLRELGAEDTKTIATKELLEAATTKLPHS